MQLDKILQSQGFGTRKYCQNLIRQRQVKVGDDVIVDPKSKFNTDDLCFSVFNQIYQFREKIYIALYKPNGYECSHQPQYHHSVYHLLPDYLINRNIQTVGRLDQDTTGLLLLTDDGQFLHALTHPKKHVEKFYAMHTRDQITVQQIQQLENGVELRNEKGCFAASKIEILAEKQLRFAIDQGIYHQVKRMLAAVNNEVIDLHRDQIADLTLSSLNLQKGEWCYLDQKQYQQVLKQL